MKLDILKFAAFTVLLLCAIATVIFLTANMLTTTRGVTYPPTGTARTPIQFGVNANLEQYNDADLTSALTMIRDARLTLVRQHFYWKEIEPRQNEFDWDKWDRIVARATEYGLELVAVIDSTPVWARDPGEADLDYAPPKNPDDYARFVSAFVRRYGDDSSSRLNVQIWDNPNVHPFWGRHNANPFEYAALLQASTIAARKTNPNVKIISAGLAPNGELVREHPNYSDVLFLREMYEAGARDYMDIVAAKPYGMWSGPDDLRADKEIFNFSRAIVLRDEMIAHSDASKPLWAVEFGWNSLPNEWHGSPSPWGTDAEELQNVRLYSAIQRARSEWNPWMAGMILQTFQPSAASDDPIWGFSLVDKNFLPRAFYSTLTRAVSTSVPPPSFDFMQFYASLSALAVVSGISAWRGLVVARSIPWQRYWRAIELRYSALPELAQLAVLAFAVTAFCISPNTILNFVLLTLIVFLFALRLDLGFFTTICTIPFYLLPKNLIGSAQFSLVELLTLACVVAWAIRTVSNSTFQGFRLSSLKRVTMRLETMDWAVVFFVLAGLVAVRVAANFGVANRELRVIVLEPAFLYALLRVSNLTRLNGWRLVDALVLSALAVSLIGLFQFYFTNWVIIGEGVRRILAVYGSPNNLALYLDRVLPLIIALAIFDDRPLTLPPTLPLRTAHLHRTAFGAVQVSGIIVFLEARGRRFVYTLAAIPIALCLYLTYSRAALLLGLPAGLIFIALMSGRRARVALGALFLVGLIALIPFMQTERAQSLFQTGTGTGFFRVSMWQSAIEMIRDHPIFGVGLDNFLYEYPKYIKPDAWREPNPSHPHNLILDFWSRMGIPGVIALVWMLVAFYRAGWKSIIHLSPHTKGDKRGIQGDWGERRALAVALMAGMTAAIAHGMIDATYFFVDLAFTWMLLIGLGKVAIHS